MGARGPLRAGIADYRMGNLASVSKALERIGARTQVSAEPSVLEEAELLVLPGVGHFAAGMEHLRRPGLDTFVTDWAEAGSPLLGICLGMQLLFERSEEGDAQGLGLLPGEVVRIRGAVKVPHMGWNTLEATTGTFAPFDGRRFYFVHSYVCVPTRWDAVAHTSYGDSFVSAIRLSGIVGVQFHPEKSSVDGLALLARMVQEVVSPPVGEPTR